MIAPPLPQMSRGSIPASQAVDIVTAWCLLNKSDRHGGRPGRGGSREETVCDYGDVRQVPSAAARLNDAFEYARGCE